MSSYSIHDSLGVVKGIGPALLTSFANHNFRTIKDVLLSIPLRYEDRSVIKKISELVVGELVTLRAEVTTSSNFYKGRRSIQSATVKDETGRIKLMWFNNPHVVKNLVKGQEFFVSGKLGDRGTMIQPTIETVKTDTIHTGRLVPIYSAVPEIPPATFRRLLKEIVDHLAPLTDLPTAALPELRQLPMALNHAFSQLHFPTETEQVILARERLALEELLAVIQHSQQLKEEWQKLGTAAKIPSANVTAVLAKHHLPFTLTGAQQRCISQILSDLQSETAMNRLLIGDVGSGKTAVAGVACSEVVNAGFSAALVAPTQILAEQHLATFQKVFPNLPVKLVTAKQKLESSEIGQQPTVYIGTHAVLNYLTEISPALLIYDEQHRFGVKQRSVSQHLTRPAHVLTLSATPIPRSLMLTLFSHLQLSVIDELPAGRLPIQTWLVPEKKRADSLAWIAKTLSETRARTGQTAQALVVCPFIDQSTAEGLDNIAAATTTFASLQEFYSTNKPDLRLALLHGRQKKPLQHQLTDQLYNREIDLLVTTPIVEVGVDLPGAEIIVIEAAERFGLASLHQLRGRVGRAGQQAYCLLFTNAKGGDTTTRLKKFCELHNGLELAELDLQRRGAGDLFGTQQHGLDQLQFAEWTNLQLITQAKQITDHLKEKHVTYQPIIQVGEPITDIANQEIPLAN